MLLCMNQDITNDFSTKFIIVECASLNIARTLIANTKNTGAWKGRLKRFLVDPYPVELAKNGTDII